MRMNDNENLMQMLPVGCGYFRLLCNAGGQADDYLFLEINPAFERMTGLRQEEVQGKRASEVLPGREGCGFDWLAFFAGAVRSGETRETTQWFADAGRYYKVLAAAQKETFSVVLEDVSAEMITVKSADLQRKQNELNLQDLDAVFNGTHDALLLVGFSGGTFCSLRSNAVHQRLSGLSSVAGKTPAELFGKEIGETLVSHCERCVRSGETAAYEQAYPSETGERVWQTEITPVFSHGSIRYLLCASRDVTERVSLQKEKEQLTLQLQCALEQSRFLRCRDPVTGLADRRGMMKTLNRLDTEKALPLSVAVVEMDGPGGDGFGDRAGDALLQQTARLLKGNCRKSDGLARLEGSAFAVWMPRTDLDAAEERMQKLKHSCKSLDGKAPRLRLSFGCAVKESAGGGMQAVLRRAGERMARQKLLDEENGRAAPLRPLLAALHEASAETELHGRRLQRLCRVMGRALRLSAGELDELSLFALLHDIGKLGVSPQILHKPARLAADEWEEIKRHPVIGCRIVRTVPELAAVAGLILSHHERWDGKGYPRGLAGTDIPLACRVLAVADSYDAMTHDRAYRKAMPPSAAIEELRRNAGTQFDPEIVALFCRLHGDAAGPSAGEHPLPGAQVRTEKSAHE